jgi:regulator of replication initiation timing
MKIKITIAFLLILVIGASGAAGYVYVDNWKKGVEKEKTYLQDKVANLYAQNKDLKEQVSDLDRKNKQISNEIKQPLQEIESTKKTTAISEEQTIKGLTWVNLRSQGIDSKFKDITVKKTDNWATANAAPKDTAKYDNLLFLFKKKDGEWKLLNYGSGLSQSDYAGSPSSIWK